MKIAPELITKIAIAICNLQAYKGSEHSWVGLTKEEQDSMCAKVKDHIENPRNPTAVAVRKLVDDKYKYVLENEEEFIFEEVIRIFK